MTLLTIRVTMIVRASVVKYYGTVSFFSVLMIIIIIIPLLYRFDYTVGGL